MSNSSQTSPSRILSLVVGLSGVGAIVSTAGHLYYRHKVNKLRNQQDVESTSCIEKYASRISLCDYGLGLSILSAGIGAGISIVQALKQK